ncbi:hypothetical protein SKAU_G00133320 [Synaphobranchus kaupii]|uniref:ADP-ribosylation factor-like protein 5C n=1 Tax=Synaphobranchus kaupii TaxID=118154 RepID=A0A9Q1FRD5_SYNKA|nr:hypothetical protein SKAU_G00133320 [Synaphobranchus kaupii]
MGLLFAKLMTVFGDREHKVIIVGLDNAGKTTILYQFLAKEAVHTSPTVGSNVEEISVRKTRFLVWDIGGQESLRTSWNSYYCDTEIVILVVDSTDRERLTLTREELHRMLAHEDLQNAAVLVLANKQDMKDSMTAAEISQCLTLSSITGHSWHIQACCALTGEGLPAGLDWMRRGLPGLLSTASIAQKMALRSQIHEQDQLRQGHFSRFQALSRAGPLRTPSGPQGTLSSVAPRNSVSLSHSQFRSALRALPAAP